MTDEGSFVQLRDEKGGSRRAGEERRTDAGATWKGVDRFIADLAARQHGLVARRQLLSRGIGRGAIDRRIERGQLHQVHRGVYAVGHRLLSTDGRWTAAVLACGTGAVLSHRTAGQLWGILPRSSGALELTRPGHFKPRAGIVCHRATVPPDERDVVDGIPVTSIHRTQFDLAGMLTRRQLERMLNEAEVRRLTDRLSIPQLMERYPGKRGSVVLRELLGAKRHVDISRNDFEELFLALVDESGLPRPRMNASLWIRGRFFEPDCLWREQRLMVELDGREVHATDAAFEDDRERDRILLAEGWRTARVTWRQLRDEPAAVAADLRLALERRT
jgi:putative AbiEi antitoxin of type IV toxin-antitoxin system